MTLTFRLLAPVEASRAADCLLRTLIPLKCENRSIPAGASRVLSALLPALDASKASTLAAKGSDGLHSCSLWSDTLLADVTERLNFCFRWWR